MNWAQHQLLYLGLEFRASVPLAICAQGAVEIGSVSFRILSCLSADHVRVLPSLLYNLLVQWYNSASRVHGSVHEVKRQPVEQSNTERKASGRKTEPLPVKRMATPLEAKLRERLPAILEDEPVRLAYLYGSSVTGQTTPFSDIDIALVVGHAIDPLNRLKLILRVKLALADRCDIENADVRVIDDAPLVFRGRVVSDGISVYVREEGERVAFETTTRMRYFDYLPIHRGLQVEFFEDLRERGLCWRILTRSLAAWETCYEAQHQGGLVERQGNWLSPGPPPSIVDCPASRGVLVAGRAP